MDHTTPHAATRRSVLLAGGALFGAAFLPKSAHASNTRDPRLVVLVLRGALDGLAAVGPFGDPDYAGLHSELALRRDGPHAGLPLDGFFLLNPGMPHFAKLFRDNQAAIVHAVATPYRDRSHFDGQDILESGFDRPGRTTSGWLNRVIETLPKGEKAQASRGLAVGAVAPLIMRGSAPVLGWSPTNLPPPGEDLTSRLLALYKTNDPVLAGALGQSLETEKIANRERGQAPGGGEAALMQRVAEGAAKLIAAEDGPRIAALAFDGWDTHANEGGPTGRLAMLLSGLDGALNAFQMGLGPAWKDTVVVAITEFGRTAKINGTTGTDHGTGTVAFLAGGAVKGGRVIADWPGLSLAALHEKRDLRPTTDLRAVLKGVLSDHLGLSNAALGEKIFPGSIGVQPMQNLIATA
ncbi:MAG: DUF1501 domain-containing protein [Beijerinckiaceae bacterium]|nr:DUF1501 domain-containing protein [Beijerinckiaceae bacterium]